MKNSNMFRQLMARNATVNLSCQNLSLVTAQTYFPAPRRLFLLMEATGLVQVDAMLIPNLFPSRNVAGQWNQVFVQPLREEEVTVRQDQDPRVSQL